MIRVVIIDDETLIQTGLSMILRSGGDIEVVGTGDGVEAAGLIERTRPDVVLLDIRMPKVDGLSVLRRVRAEADPPVVAMLTTFDTDEFITRALRSGAAGYLLKDTDPEQLVQAVRLLASGGTTFSAAVTHRMVDARAEAHSPLPEWVEGLTARERDVLGLLAEGCSNAEIAERLHLGLGTVKDHVSVLLDKLDAANRVQAAVIAHRAGPVEIWGRG
ncbi:response regulator transcription factor [Nocardiopsis rhodophaea]|uniref:Response regulator transcription factor n=1 Tax=Nocardiopsis rhodophaea TaxID=280238 RepID=A0ABN2TK18_9ACTN